MTTPAKQIDMSFSGDNRLAELIHTGEFQYFMEYDSPLSCQSFHASQVLIEDLGKELRAVERLYGILLTDRLLSVNCHPPVPLAETFAKSSGKPVIMGVSGRGCDLNHAQGLLADAKAAGLRNFLAVSGNLPDSAESLPCTDSVEILQATRSFGKDITAGAVVNPFKYTPEDQCLQYAKMLRKLHSGAKFLITQAGWDMKKAQELQWFLQKMSVPAYVIARVCIISQDEARKLATGFQPGVALPIPIASLIQQDAEKTPEEFQRTQLLRAAWQITGYRKLGYNAILLSGLRTAKAFQDLFQLVDEVEAQCPDYDSWLQLWEAKHAGLNLTPFHQAHYLYKNLLTKEHRDYEKGVTIAQGTALPKPPLADKIRYLWGRFLDSPAKNSPTRDALCKILRISKARLRGNAACFYLEPAPCPKKLHWGACGSSRCDGTCEDEKHPCFYHRVLHLAASTNQYHVLEIPPDQTHEKK